jgi:hypothetical protein
MKTTEEEPLAPFTITSRTRAPGLFMFTPTAQQTGTEAQGGHFGRVGHSPSSVSGRLPPLLEVPVNFDTPAPLSAPFESPSDLQRQLSVDSLSSHRTSSTGESAPQRRRPFKSPRKPRTIPNIIPPLPSDDDARDVNVGQASQQQPASDYSEPPQLLPWQRVHQRLLEWGFAWSVSELDIALNSTLRGNQVDGVALSIWSIQTYKRYVRSKMTDGTGRVDRLFVPPNMADAISDAVFHGRHADAAEMLREQWHPFGFEGMPRLLVVLAKHRSDANHWLVHRSVLYPISRAAILEA